MSHRIHCRSEGPRFGGEDEVFFYLDELHAKGQLNMWDAHANVRRLFSMPPARSIELINKWSRTFTKRHLKKNLP